MQALIKKYYRYVIFMIRVYLYEKPRGLDFHMRDLTENKKSHGKIHGYSVSPEKHLKNIFKFLNITDRDGFLDIGCGKGFVLAYATKFNYHKIAGFDIFPNLTKIAEKNISILKLNNRVEVLTEDATRFSRYGEFNHLFMFNPFPSEIMESTLQRIVNSMDEIPRKLTIIYYNPTCHEDIVATGRFHIVKELYDSMKGYKTFIYESI